jgi:glycerol-3-phosphate dehydrogenase (NAD(P)+)
MNIAILGDGGWGTALGLVLTGNGHKVRLWGPFPEYVARVADSRENIKFLPGVELPPSIRLTADREEAVRDAEVCVLATPSKYLASVLEGFAPLLPSACDMVSVVKGLSKDGHQRMTEVAREILGRDVIAALSGPSHAEEVARGVPTAVVVACTRLEAAERLQQVFSGTRFRVYSSEDVVGVELGGALKNVIAIAAGVSDGIGFGDNTKAALVTRGLAEMTRLGAALGARPATFAGLSGLGDLMVTCTSRLSRNRRVGERLGRGESTEHILGSMEQVAEGVWTCASARLLAADEGVEVPITDEVYAIVHEGKDPREAVQALLSREPKSET